MIKNLLETLKTLFLKNFQEIFLILKKKINTGCILSVVIENKIYNS